MAQATIAADLHQSLDVLRSFATQVTLDRVVCIDVVTQLDDLFLGEIAHARVGINAGLLADLLCAGQTDTVDVSQTNLHALVARKVDTEYTSQCRSPS